MKLFPPSSPSSSPTVSYRSFKAGEQFHRVHSRNRSGSVFNPCMGKDTRFTHLYDADSGCIPAMYAAQSLDGAFYETLFHDHPVTVPTRPLVAKKKIKGLKVSIIETSRRIRLIRLFTPEQQALGISGTALTLCLSGQYPVTRQWADYLISHEPKADGFIWTSRQDSASQSIVLYDRGNNLSLSVKSFRDGASDPSVEVDARQIGARGGISIV